MLTFLSVCNDYIAFYYTESFSNSDVCTPLSDICETFTFASTSPRKTAANIKFTTIKENYFD